MSQSEHLKSLRKRLGQIRRHFLPRKFSATGTYTARQLDMARAYRLLAHAEIEAYIEEISKAVVVEKVTDWKKSRIPSMTLIAFLACYHAGWADSSDAPSALPVNGRSVKNDPDTVIDHALRQYNAKLKENHGVKESNLRLLIPPTGVRWSDLDLTWVAALDAFGTQRGLVAHTSIVAHHVIDPKSELDTVKALFLGLEKLDGLMGKARK